MRDRVSESEVIETVEEAGELFQSGGVGWWRDLRRHDPADPDSWSPPIKVGSTAFRRVIFGLFPSIAPTKQKCKPYVEAVEAVALGKRRVPAHGWQSLTNPGPDAELRIAISPATVVVVSRHALHAEPNGETGLYAIHPDTTPLRWADLAAAAAAVTNPCAFAAMRQAVVDHMPPPAPDAVFDRRAQTAIVLGWWSSMLTAPLCRGRPLIAMLGETSSGKTLTSLLFGVAFYGPDFRVSATSSGSRAIKDMLATLVHRPFSVFDDVTRVHPDTVQTLCQVVTGATIDVATYHETMELSTFQADSATIITSARPAWALRDDLLNRILPIRLGSPGSAVLTDGERKSRVVRARTAIWAELLLATQQMLRHTTRVAYYTRFQDWEQLARAAAKTGGWDDDLERALQLLPRQRVSMATAADGEVHALYAVAKAFEADPRGWTIAELYDIVMENIGAQLAEDPRFRPSNRLRIQDFGKFLRRIETQGSAAVNVRRGPKKPNGAQTWIVTPKA